MDHFATHTFRYAGVTYAEADPVDLDGRTLAHLRVAGWVTAVPTAAP